MKVGPRRIVEEDERQAAGIRYHAEVRGQHLRPQVTAHHHRIWGEDEQRRGASLLQHSRKTCCPQASVCVKTSDDGQTISDGLQSDVQKVPLLVVGKRVHFGRVAVDGDR